MSTKVFDSVSGATTHRSIFEQPQPTNIPQQIVALCQQHGVTGVAVAATTGQKIDVRQLDAHFKKRGTSLDDRMAVKASLAQIGVL